MRTQSKQTSHVARVVLSLLTVLTIFGVGARAFAGRDGGGGGAVYCMGYNDPMRPKWAKPVLDWAGGTVTLLDLYEAENDLLPFRHKLVVPHSNQPVEVQVRNAINKMRVVNPDFAAAIWKSYLHIMQPGHNDRRSSYNILAPPSNDTGEHFYKDGCKPTGIGYYDDINDVLEIAQSTLEKMDYTDRAAFWLHEAIYRILRLGSGENNSIETRLIVGHLLSNQPMESLITHRLAKSFICERPVSTDVNAPTNGIKFVLHTDGDVTTLVPISVHRFGLPIDQGGEYFWKPAQYIVDFKASSSSATAQQSNGANTPYVSNFNGKLSQLLMKIGTPISQEALQIKYTGPDNVVDASLVPVRSKYYGIRFYNGFYAHQMCNNAGCTYGSSVFSTVNEFNHGIIKLSADIAEDFYRATSGKPNNMRFQRYDHEMPDSAFTVTCREF